MNNLQKYLEEKSRQAQKGAEAQRELENEDRRFANTCDLDDLRGPTDVLSLPINIDWTPRAGKSYDLSNEHDVRIAYRLVLSEGTDDDLKRYLNAGLLVKIWPALRKTVPWQVARKWDQKLEEAERYE